MHNARSPYLLGFWSSLALLLIQAVAAQSSYPRMASSCLPSGADAPFTQDTLLEREQIESRFHQNPKQLLTTEVPGFSALGDREPVLRGRQARVLIDGVPVAADEELLSTLDLDLIERVEVIPGPSVLC